MSGTTHRYTANEIESIIAKALRRARYEGYLMSQRWADKRQQKLEEENYTCEKCGYNPNWSTSPIYVPLDVHHLTYDNLGDEPLEDLQVLCRSCHMLIHGRRF